MAIVVWRHGSLVLLGKCLFLVKIFSFSCFSQKLATSASGLCVDYLWQKFYMVVVTDLLV